MEGTRKEGIRKEAEDSESVNGDVEFCIITALPLVATTTRDFHNTPLYNFNSHCDLADENRPSTYYQLERFFFELDIGQMIWRWFAFRRNWGSKNLQSLCHRLQVPSKFLQYDLPSLRVTRLLNSLLWTACMLRSIVSSTIPYLQDRANASHESLYVVVLPSWCYHLKSRLSRFSWICSGWLE